MVAPCFSHGEARTNGRGLSGAHASFRDLKDVKQLAAAVSERIKAECPGVHWKDSWATTGHFDVVDVVESDDPKEVTRAAMIIHAYGHATTETALATPWKEFLASL
ncbi:MAG: GYD domain-containing protein [Candidatus Methylomirabilaceae bacterium]